MGIVGSEIKGVYKFHDVIGCNNIKEIINHIKTDKNDTIPSFLFWGPAGDGKSFVAKAIGKEKSMRVLEVTFSNLNKVGRLKDVFSQARIMAPCVLLLESIDVMVERGGYNYTNVFKNQMNRLATEYRGVMVIATTDRQQILDESFRGKFSNKIYFPHPSDENRKELFRKYLSPLDTNNQLWDAQYAALVNRTQRFSFGDIRNACRVQLPIITNSRIKTYEHFRLENVLVWGGGNSLERVEAYVPCEEYHKNQVPLKNVLRSDKYKVSFPVELGIVMEAIGLVHPQVSEESLQLFEAWAGYATIA